MFNKDTGRTYDEINELIPRFFYFNNNDWIDDDDMTDDEKKEYPEYKTTGGYLKVLDYKQAWRLSWDKTTEEDRKKCLELPNWDNEIFKEITGIDVEMELDKKETILTLDEIAQKFGVDVKDLKIKKD